MEAIEAIKIGLATAELVAFSYLQDFDDEDLLARPHPNCNSIQWQIGHLIHSEHQMLGSIAPGRMPKLPAGFELHYSKEATAGEGVENDKPESKSRLIELYHEQRESTLDILSGYSREDLELPTEIDYAANHGSVFIMQGSHWLMHCGQWVIVRRQKNKPYIL